MKLLRYAGNAQNEKAMKHMEAMLRLAKDFDCSRFDTREPDAAPDPGEEHPVADDAPCDRRATGPETLCVLSRDKTGTRYTMQRPASKFAACDCEHGRQMHICHHQVAYLMQQSCDQAAAEKLLYKMLGVRFGFLGGCTEEDISDLTEALRAQAPPTPAQPTAAAAPAQRALTALAADEHAPAASDCAPAAPLSMGADARKRFCADTLAKLSEALQRFEAAPEAAHAHLAKLITSHVGHAYDACALASEGFALPESAEFQSTGDGMFKRKLGAIERSSQRRRKSSISAATGVGSAAAAQPTDGAGAAPATAQANFAHSSQCGSGPTKLYPSKAFSAGRGCKEAAQYVQDALNQRAARAEASVRAKHTAGAAQAGAGAGDPHAGRSAAHGGQSDAAGCSGAAEQQTTNTRPKRAKAPARGRFVHADDDGYGERHH